MTKPGSYAVRLARKVEKFLDRLPDKHFDQIERRLVGLRSDARPHDSIQLTCRGKERRLDAGEHRALYEINDEVCVVDVFKIAKRADKTIYRVR